MLTMSMKWEMTSLRLQQGQEINNVELFSLTVQLYVFFYEIDHLANLEFAWVWARIAARHMDAALCMGHWWEQDVNWIDLY